jgi:CheY-like chemotaxis protein
MTATPPAILVVDDEADNRANLADILTDLGYQVDTAADGPSALELVRRRRYDVALVDLVMPGMDGAALYGEVRKAWAGTVAVLVTAYPNSPRADAARAAGAWQVVPKPVEIPRLLDLVEEALGQPLVLVVDDDADLCASLWDLLRERGYRVCLAHGVRAAADRLGAESPFQVVLLDWKLPDGDGAEVLRAARRANAPAQVAVITGHRVELEQRLGQVLAEGARAVLHKPFDVAELLATVQRLAAGPGGSQGA